MPRPRRLRRPQRSQRVQRRAPAPSPPQESRAPRAIAFALLGGAGIYALYRLFTAVGDAIADTQSAVQGTSAYWPLVVEAANNANIPVWALAAIVDTESSWDNSPRSRSNAEGCKVSCRASAPPTCAIGLAQLKVKYFARDTPSGTAEGLCDPATNLMIAARLLRQLYSRFGDWNVTFAAYNQGQGAVQNAIERGENPISVAPGYVRTTAKAALQFGAGSAVAGVFAARPTVSFFRIAA